MGMRPFGRDWEGYFLGEEGEEIPPMGIQPEAGRGQAEPAVEIPEELPILPLRGVVVYPLTVVPLAIGQPRSIRLIDDAVLGRKLIGLVASKRPELEEPMPEDCYTVGTLALIQRLLRMPDGTMRILVLGLERIRITEYTATQPYLKARVERHPETMTPGPELEALRRKTAELFARMVELIPGLPDQLGSMAMAVEDPKQLAYAVATYLRMSLQEAQEILELDDVAAKLHKLIALLTSEIEVLELGRKIQSEAQAQVEKMQREFFLRQQLEAIRRELGEADEHQMEVEEFRRKIEEAGMPPEARREALRELERMAKLPPASAEYGVIRTYLDWMVSLPWNKTTPDNLDVAHARKVLDEDHYGLQDVKERILEYLAVRKLKQERAAQLEELETRDYIRRAREGAILCFVGPPGVGKTSLGQSIARAPSGSNGDHLHPGLHGDREVPHRDGLSDPAAAAGERPVARGDHLHRSGGAPHHPGIHPRGGSPEPGAGHRTGLPQGGHPHRPGRHPRRGGDPRLPPDLRGGHARAHHPGAAPGGIPQPGLHAGRGG